MKDHRRLRRDLEDLQRKLRAHLQHAPAPKFDRVWTVEGGVRIIHQVVDMMEMTTDLVTMRCGLVGQIAGPQTRRQVYPFVTKTEKPLTCFVCAGMEDL